MAVRTRTRYDTNRETEIVIHLPHPDTVATGEIIVDGDDLHAFTGKSMKGCGKCGNERFTLARAHLGDFTFSKRETAYYLHIEMWLVKCAASRLAHECEHEREVRHTR